jgi:hypothetical protein
MKNIICIIIGLALSFTCIAQQDTLSKVISIHLPNGTEKLDKEKFKSHMKNNYNHVRIIEANKNIYKIGDMLLTFQDLHASSTGKLTLEDTKRQMVSIMRKFDKTATIDEDSIETVNNIHFLIIKSHEDKEGHFLVYSDYNNDKYVSIILQFKMAEENEATKTLDEILKGIRFKNH